MPSDRELYGGATDAELREIRSLYSSGDWPIIEARLIREIVGLRRQFAELTAQRDALYELHKKHCHAAAERDQSRSMCRTLLQKLADVEQANRMARDLLEQSRADAQRWQRIARMAIEDYAAMLSRNCLETPSELAEALASMREGL